MGYVPTEIAITDDLEIYLFVDLFGQHEVEEIGGKLQFIWHGHLNKMMF